MSEEWFDDLLMSRTSPLPAKGLEARILAASIKIETGKSWIKELAASFVIPHPATVLPFILILGIFTGVGTQYNPWTTSTVVTSTTSSADYLYIDEGWL